MMLVSPRIVETVPAEEISVVRSEEGNRRLAVDHAEDVKFWDIPVIAVLVAKRCVPCYHVHRCASRPGLQLDFETQVDGKPTLDIDVEPYPLVRARRTHGGTKMLD